MLAWGLYLFFFKILRYRSVAEALRYGIPTVGILWYCFEITAIWGWYKEIWIRPLEYPLTNILIASAFVGIFAVAAKSRLRGAAAEVSRRS